MLSAREAVKSALSIDFVKDAVHRLFFLSLEADANAFASTIARRDRRPDGALSDHHWQGLEPIYISARRSLHRSKKWRYGPLFVRDSTKPMFDKLAEYGVSVEAKTYCDMGCGAHHPYGASSVMYVNGASACVATDIQATDRVRAAEALHDLVQDFLVNPDRWHWSGAPRSEFLARARQFDLDKLRDGDLAGGTASVPITHYVTSIYTPSIPLGTIDVMSSRAVLEHFLDFDLASQNLNRLMAPGSVAYHEIDLVDHRAYNSLDFHWWSFLSEDEKWTDGVCNRLRFSELRNRLEVAGFQIRDYQALKKEAMPAGFRARLAGRFAAMSDDELNSLRVGCLIAKA
jgi:hypothetical protein